jgi:hypothetical protein
LYSLPPERSITPALALCPFAEFLDAADGCIDVADDLGRLARPDSHGSARDRSAYPMMIRARSDAMIRA